jgi:hypothetical protein
MPSHYNLGNAVLDSWMVVLTAALIIISYRRFRSLPAKRPQSTGIVVCVIALIVLFLVRFGWR